MCRFSDLMVPLKHSLQQLELASSIELLNPFNFHSWKGDMQIQLRARGLYRVTMDTEEECTSVTDKARFLNKKDEAFRFLCLSISRDLLFRLSGLKTPKEIWDKLETMYGNRDDLRVY